MTEADQPDAETSPADASAELAKPEDISVYVEERAEEQREDRPPEDETVRLAREVRDGHPELKKASRYERLKRARDQYETENEELRKKLGTQQRDELSQALPQDQAALDEGPLQNSLRISHDAHGESFVEE